MFITKYVIHGNLKLNQAAQRNKVVLAHFKIMFLLLHGGAKESHEKCQP
jgi:hypothetical protein